MFGLIKKVFTVVLSSIANASDHAKCVSLSNQEGKIQPIFINLHPNEHSQEFHHYLFSVKLDRCVGSCITIKELPNKVYIPNDTEDLNLSVFNTITGKNELKTLTKDILWECTCKCDGTKCNSNQWCNSDKCLCEYKKVMYMKMFMFGILLYVIVKMENI